MLKKLDLKTESCKIPERIQYNVEIKLLMLAQSCGLLGTLLSDTVWIQHEYQAELIWKLSPRTRLYQKL